MDDCVTVNDHVTTLKTAGFAGCWGLIVIGADGARTMAHISPTYQLERADPNPTSPYMTVERWPHIDAFRERARAAAAVYIYHHGLQFNKEFDGDLRLRLLAIDPAKVRLMGSAEPIYAYPDGSVTPKTHEQAQREADERVQAAAEANRIRVKPRSALPPPPASNANDAKPDYKNL